LFVSNREVAYGTGDIWSVAVNAPEDLKKIFSEETAWRAQPQVAPDGRRILFSSYHGRQWQQLWLTTMQGAAPLPLTFGEFDRTQARFSPDGSRIGYISNEEGNTSLWIQEIVGGARTRINAAQRHYLKEVGRLQLSVRDEHGKRVPARVSVIAADGRAYAPDNAWMHADDGFDRSLQAFENHYFHCPGECTLILPIGDARVQVSQGLDYAIAERNVAITTKGNTTTISLEPLRLPAQYGHFASADLHVHMNYGGHYHNTPQNLIEQARAEHLDAVYNLIVNKEERVPDVAQFTTKPLRKDNVLLMQAQEFHSSYWGHLGLLDLDDHFLTPDFSSYRESAFSSPYPHNGVIAAWPTRSMVWSDTRIHSMGRSTPTRISSSLMPCRPMLPWATPIITNWWVSPITAPAPTSGIACSILVFVSQPAQGPMRWRTTLRCAARWDESGIHRHCRRGHAGKATLRPEAGPDLRE
jgi:hypothetical protein